MGSWGRPGKAVEGGDSTAVEDIPLLDADESLLNRHELPDQGKGDGASVRLNEVFDSSEEELMGYPTEEEKSGPNKLRRVSGQISWGAYLIAFIELCERFSYNGTAAVFVNFIQRPLPPGSVTGSNPTGTPGALGLGTNASTGITTFNTFWVYIIPLFGAYIADTRLGRFKTVCWSTLVALIGHVIMIFAGLPSVISSSTSFALTCFILALIIMGLGTGSFKSTISPLVAEQYKGPKHMVVVKEATGERVIVDPTITTARIYMYFYLVINVGALGGSISMTYAEKYVGFWLAFAFPTILLCICPIILWAGRKIYNTSPPSGSALADTIRIWRTAMASCWSWNPLKFKRGLQDPMFWDKVKPSVYIQRHSGHRPPWMTFDDDFVDEVKRGFKACQVFLYYPLYWVSFSQLNTNLISQAATMNTYGIPNDVMNNINPLALLILIPICDIYIYPALRRRRINFTPLKRIFAGFLTVSTAMLWAGITQYYIYQTSPCGYQANDPDCAPSPLSVWSQSGPYILIAISEIFASITGLEYAYTKAPQSMRSVVMALFLFTSAVAAAIGEVLNPLSGDPLLIWNYAVCGTGSFVGGIAFWLSFRELDRDEDALNEIGRKRHLSSDKLLAQVH